MNIKKIRGRELYNSRGWPTVCCEILLDDGFVATASVPTGMSRGSYEAQTVFDGGERLWGRGVNKCVEFINTLIAPEFEGKPPHAINADMRLLELDGTREKSKLGANTTLAVSMAMYRAHAHAEDTELYEFVGFVSGAETVSIPMPLFNMINGGMHAHNELAIQEFLVMPLGAEDFRLSMEIGATVFHELGSILKKHKKELIYGDEGGYACRFGNNEEAFDLLSEAFVRVKITHGFDALCGLDVAASRMFDPKLSRYAFGGAMLSSREMIDYYERIANTYPVFSIEDGLAEDDWDGWQLLMERLGERLQIVGDDLFVTHPQRIFNGIELKAANAAIIKPDQIGTVTEALQAVRLCKEKNITPIISHRSGETEDTFIADMAVGVSAPQIKTGGLCRSERLAKYNRLLTIEDQLMKR